MIERAARRSAAAWRTSSGLAPSILQFLVVAAIFGVTAGLAWTGLGSPARLLFMATAVAAAAWYHRRSPWLYLTLTFWFWTLTPFIRRVIDERAGFDPMNIILGTPNVMTLFMVPDLLRSRDLLHRREALIGLMLLVPVGYGLMINLVQGQIAGAAVGAADWLAPLFYYFYLIDKAPSVGDAEPHLRGFLTLNTLVVVGYGLNQFWNPPTWDLRWALFSGMLGANEATAEGARVFSTLNSQGPLAEWLGALILLSLYFRTRLTMILLPATGILLLLSYVRSVTVGVLLGLAVVTFLGGRRMVSGLGRVVVAIAAIGIIVASLDQTVGDALIARFSSLGALQNDTSALVRLSIWSNTPALIDAHPFGMGIGALGRGAVLSGKDALIDIDSGPLAIYLCLGWVAGTVYLLGMFTIVGQAVANAIRVQMPAALAFTAAAVCSVSILPFTNIDGFAGCVLWLCSGFALGYGISARVQPRLEPPDRSRGRAGMIEAQRLHAPGIVAGAARIVLRASPFR
jgi:hypothetical protein